MRILALDTSARVCSVAVMEDSLLLCEQTANRALTHSEMLMPMLEATLEEAGVSLREIDLFAAAKGPGSFTGLRIGISTIKALAHALNKPVCGVMTLDALAMNAAHCKGDVVTIMDARRGQVYAARYLGDGRTLQRVGVPEAIALNDYLEREHFAGEVLFVGDGVDPNLDIIIRAIGNRGVPALPHLRFQHAACVALCAMEMAKRGEATDQDALRPYYLRLSQAERERARKLAAGGCVR